MKKRKVEKKTTTITEITTFEFEETSDEDLKSQTLQPLKENSPRKRIPFREAIVNIVTVIIAKLFG